MRANQTLDARVYVGTYAKYNNGNIDGAWISLNSCDSYEDFLKKCATIHQDEADPEYMIQDCENMPDGLDCGEWLSEKEFNDIKAERGDIGQIRRCKGGRRTEERRKQNRSNKIPF